jgi:putative ABC transport system permease protein
MFPVLGIEPVLGRTFTQQEDDTSAPVTVISYGLWQERYQGDPRVFGKTIDLDRRPYTVIGVMPADFQTPLGLGGLVP